MNKLAEKLGMDPVEFRLKNALEGRRHAGRRHAHAEPRQHYECIEAARDSFKWKKKKRKAEGKGKNPPSCADAVLRLGSRTSAFRLGIRKTAGQKLKFTATAASNAWSCITPARKLDRVRIRSWCKWRRRYSAFLRSRIELKTSDTATQGNPGSASASRLTFMAGNSIKGAAELALEKWKAEERPAIANFNISPRAPRPWTRKRAIRCPTSNMRMLPKPWKWNWTPKPVTCAVTRITSADDVGKAINPDLVVGQIEGAVVQAHGYAVLEDYKTRDGKVMTDQFSTYLIPTIWDIPRKSGFRHRGSARPERTVGRARHGRTALPACGSRHRRRHPRCDRRLDHEFPFTPERVLRALGKIK
jgi:CO/xanthine dehydrogenase Mo-binding subunit